MQKQNINVNHVVLRICNYGIKRHKRNLWKKLDHSNVWFKTSNFMRQRFLNYLKKEILIFPI